MKSNLSLFKNKSFLFFFFAALFGVLGEGIYGLTTIVIVLEKTDSIVEIGKLLVLTLLPSMLLAPFLGVLIDRFNKIKLAFLCNLLRFLAIVIIPASVAFGFFYVSIFYVSILLSYMIWFIIEPLKESILKEILSPEEYKQGISLVQGAWQLGLLVSAIIAGILMDKLGTTEAILTASLVYILAGFLFVGINTKGDKEASKIEGKPTLKQYRAELVQGWNYIFQNKKVLYFALATSMVLPFFYSINTLIAPFNYQALKGDGISLGIIDSGAGIGSLISAILCTFWVRNHAIPRVVLAAISLTALSTVLFSLTTSVPFAFIMYLMMGMFIGMVKVLTRLLLFEEVEEKLVGRVMTSVSFVSLAVSIMMSLLIAFIGEVCLTYGYLVISMGLIIPFALTWKGCKSRSLTNFFVEKEKRSDKEEGVYDAY
ncbi:MFS transporter [Neobacillus rhizosphaerae]|uniref:MFS transporter n=1 Tax=Neobacillus rhizosphaerae TaxID=2880965 RepID=UPI003D272345